MFHVYTFIFILTRVFANATLKTIQDSFLLKGVDYLPKVKKGYFEDKKNSILDVAEKICMNKPLNKLTMKDIITETGLSPGAVYASFSDIDEVIIALVNRMSIEVNFISAVEEILLAGDNPEVVIKKLINYLINLINSSVTTYGKTLSELVFVAVDKDRGEKIMQGIHEIQMYEYIRDTLVKVISENIRNGYFKPLVTEESIYALIFSFMDGLVRGLSLVKNYKLENLPMGVTFEEKDLSTAITDSVIFLLKQGR